jgi:hypothetical protein
LEGLVWGVPLPVWCDGAVGERGSLDHGGGVWEEVGEAVVRQVSVGRQLFG